MAARYAIYYAPTPDSVLAAFGRTWLGRDADTGGDIPQPEVPGLTPEKLRALTAEPRRYGFHGTLKPPFGLADGATAASLREAIAALAAGRSPFVIPTLTLRRLGRFIALTPDRSVPELAMLAADCVRSFDRFRRPSGADELARRRAAGLTERQETLLRLWGYPYVLEEFRFHLTLTGPIADDRERDLFFERLDELTVGVRAHPVTVAEVALFAQTAGEESFRIVERFPFGR